MNPQPSASPLSSAELVDEYFLENRTKILAIAAFLDRLDRAEPSAAATDFRMKAFAEALEVLSGRPGNRLERIQLALSDPTEEPREALDRKGAVGAYDRWSPEARS